MLAGLLFLFSVVLLGQARPQAGGQTQGVDIEVLSHICKYGVHSDGRRERMECWAALSFCKRDVNRGPINPRQPKDFENFRILEYRQELRLASTVSTLSYTIILQGVQLERVSPV